MGWSVLRKPGLTFHNPAYTYQGYTFCTAVGGDATLLLDMQGHIVHRWQFADVRPEYAYLLDNGNLLYRALPKALQRAFKPAEEDDPAMPLEERARMLPSNYRYLREADWEGNTVWQYEDPLLHHDFWKTRHDTYLVSRFVQMTKALSDRVRAERRAKRAQQPMLTDEYLEIDRAGNIVWSVRLDDLLDLRLDPLGPLEQCIEWTP